MRTETLMLIEGAREYLRKTALAEAAGNPLSAAFLGWLLQRGEWIALLEDAASRASVIKGAERSSRNVAVLGFACGVGALKTRFAAEFVRQLEWSMGRPNFTAGGEPCGVVADPMNFAGVVSGAENVLADEARKRFEDWAATAWSDADRLGQDGGWRRGLLDVMQKRVGAKNGILAERAQDPWLVAAMQRRGWTSPDEVSVSEVLRSALTDVGRVGDGFEAGLRLAAIDWAVSRAMDFDVAALTQADVSTVLHRIPSVFQRWTWEDKPRTKRPGAEPRRWHVENEYHFQSLLYTVLKPLIPGLDEEQYLPPTGTYQPRADLCIRELELVVEVKFWYRTKSVKDLTEEIASDLTLYLRKESPYRQVIAAIWDDGARTEEHTELARGLRGLAGLADVIIVSRPAFMASAEVPSSDGQASGRRKTSSGGGTGRGRRRATRSGQDINPR